MALSSNGASLVALIKPQFEALREEIENGTGGEFENHLRQETRLSSASPPTPLSLSLSLSADIYSAVVRDEEVRSRVCQEVQDWLVTQGWAPKGLTQSPIKGPAGNVEFIVYAVRE